MTLRWPLRDSRATALVALFLFACGRDVDLGGTADAGDALDATTDTSTDAAVIDSSAPVGGGFCAPCVSAADCRSGRICGRVAGIFVCAIECTSTDAGACTTDQTCGFFEAPGDVHLLACIPKSGVCPADAGNDPCTDYAGPSVSASCTGCVPSTDDCGLNGCFRPAYCNVVTRKCEPAPNGCP